MELCITVKTVLRATWKHAVSEVGQFRQVEVLKHMDNSLFLISNAYHICAAFLCHLRSSVFTKKKPGLIQLYLSGQIVKLLT